MRLRQAPSTTIVIADEPDYDARLPAASIAAELPADADPPSASEPATSAAETSFPPDLAPGPRSAPLHALRLLTGQRAIVATAALLVLAAGALLGTYAANRIRETGPAEQPRAAAPIPTETVPRPRVQERQRDILAARRAARRRNRARSLEHARARRARIVRRRRARPPAREHAPTPQRGVRRIAPAVPAPQDPPAEEFGVL